jgi:hypothetical protein
MGMGDRADRGTYRGAALLGADGEAEGDEVDEQDGGQHRVGAGHGWGWLAPQSSPITWSEISD